MTPPTANRPTGSPIDTASSDACVLDLLRSGPGMTVAQLAEALDVTATAVRQRLVRMRAAGLISRQAEKAGRGRPQHIYQLTPAGRRKAGANFADLAAVLWDEVRSIRDPETRRGLLSRLASRMSEMYEPQLEGGTLRERMTSVAKLFGDKRIPFTVEETSRGEQLPVLKAHACPYPDLAEKDRGVCAMERMMVSEMLGADVKLSQCRLDGDDCCEFQPVQIACDGATS